MCIENRPYTDWVLDFFPPAGQDRAAEAVQSVEIVTRREFARFE